MGRAVKVPRASIAVTILDDPDCIALLQDVEGREAFALFCLLLAAARDQDNGGKFNHPSAVVASLVRLPVEAYSKCLASLVQRTDWVIADATSVAVRSYRRWNSWGGPRDGAGRKPSANQDRIQDAPKTESSRHLPTAVPVVTTTLGLETTNPAAILGYAHACCGLTLPRKLVVDSLEAYGTAEPLVEALEHFASRPVKTRWLGARNKVGVFKHKAEEAADGNALTREGPYQPFTQWLAAQDARLSSIGKAGAA